ncbi:hypothetical protein KUTeg_016925 [Tegillarca granosa]|uniref:non-specific serine/threonine protein kinase n=1 Tax=Tegillarca granosa TaxID=220873 RepID=A0ABQ9EMI1_TEGGR|nr:hypothetical protein KUTeg_016925 [Tegillarca granosa]
MVPLAQPHLFMQNKLVIHSGYYNATTKTNLVILGLNTNIYYSMDKATAHKQDPAGQFDWLQKQLMQARLRNQKVFIVSHVPPGEFELVRDIMWFYSDYNNKYLEIMRTHKDEISSQIYGHEHTDSFRILRDHKDKKQVIIKQIPVEQMTKEERQAALNEVKVLSMLSHPNIIQYYENFLEDKALMIFLAQMLLSIQHVHSKQILHRDLKTQNILLDRKREVVKIGDFGISKVLSSKSKAYTVVGTPCYISPELCEGKPYNQKSDIWALGCVLYELASLKRAFEAANLPALILKIMRGTFAPISEIYSEDLRTLILSMLHLDPNRRPHINQIMAQPIVINALMNLHTDMGKLPYPLSSKPPALSSVFSWGSGSASPIKLQLPTSDTQVTQVSTGRTQKAAVTKNGRLFVWETSAMGTDTLIPGATDGHTHSLVPRYLEGQSAVNIQHAKIVEALLGYGVIQVSCGASHVLAVTNEHEVFAWGRGDNGRLGLGSQESYSSPQLVPIPESLRPSSVHCGVDCSAVLTLDNKLLCCGRLDMFNPDGTCSKSIEEVHCFCQSLCHPVENLLIKAVAMGTSHTVAVTVEGHCYAFGSNQFGQLGNQSINTRQPQQVKSLDANKITMVACGDTFTVAVTEYGDVYSWGNSSRGRLGRSDEETCIPQKVTFTGEEQFSVVSISCSHGNTLLATRPMHRTDSPID